MTNWTQIYFVMGATLVAALILVALLVKQLREALGERAVYQGGQWCHQIDEIDLDELKETAGDTARWIVYEYGRPAAVLTLAVAAIFLGVPQVQSALHRGAIGMHRGLYGRTVIATGDASKCEEAMGDCWYSLAGKDFLYANREDGISRRYLLFRKWDKVTFSEEEYSRYDPRPIPVKIIRGGKLVQLPPL